MNPTFLFHDSLSRFSEFFRNDQSVEENVSHQTYITEDLESTETFSSPEKSASDFDEEGMLPPDLSPDSFSLQFSPSEPHLEDILSQIPWEIKYDFFSQEIDATTFKNYLSWFLLYSADGIHHAVLPDELLKIVIDSISTQWCLKSDFLIEKVGFKSQESIDKFLKIPPLIMTLKKNIRIPEKRLSKQLHLELISVHKKIKEAHTVILEKPMQTTESVKIDDLFPIFEFFKARSDEELAIIETYFSYKEQILVYTKNHSLVEFKNDLNSMALSDFELKYEGCFSGMGENVIGHILDAEELFLLLDTFP